jgi:hypothetical protein
MSDIDEIKAVKDCFEKLVLKNKESRNINNKIELKVDDNKVLTIPRFGDYFHDIAFNKPIINGVSGSIVSLFLYGNHDRMMNATNIMNERLARIYKLKDKTI